MMHRRAETNIDNPPGQIRYLRDVIKKYQEEEGYKPLEAPQAMVPSTSAEKRLEGLVGALLMACESRGSLTSADIENLIYNYAQD